MKSVKPKYYIIRKCGSLREALSTKHYLFDKNGTLIGTANGVKYDIPINLSTKIPLKYHVKVYRTTRGNVEITIYDAWKGKEIMKLHTAYNKPVDFIIALEEFPFLKKVFSTHLPSFNKWCL